LSCVNLVIKTRKIPRGAVRDPNEISHAQTLTR
jgi:hypothetical protein